MDKSDLEKLIDEEYKLALLQEEFDKDCVLPKESKLLYNSNLDTGLLLNKWSSKYSRAKMRYKELELEVTRIENEVKQKCRHDKSFNGNRIIDKHEMEEKVFLDPEYQDLYRKKTRLGVIISQIEVYVDHFKFRNALIQNQIELLKFINMAY